METKLEKEVRFLKIYALVATVGFALFILTGFAVKNDKQKFEEMDVERINIVGKDGKLRMVISNSERQHPGIVDGKTMPNRKRGAGMLFFNDKGDEMGGLTFGGNTGEGQGASLAFDKFRGDEAIKFQYSENPTGANAAAITIIDQPAVPLSELITKMNDVQKISDETAKKAALKQMEEKGEFPVSRLTFGKNPDKSAAISLADAKGKPRIKISVAADGTSKLEFLDENGKVTYSLPDATKSEK